MEGRTWWGPTWADSPLVQLFTCLPTYCTPSSWAPDIAWTSQPCSCLSDFVTAVSSFWNVLPLDEHGCCLPYWDLSSNIPSSVSPPFLTNGKLTAPSTALYHLKRLCFFLALSMIWSDLVCFLCTVCLPHRNESCTVARALSPAASTVPTTRLPGPPWKVVKVVHCTRALAEGLVVLISSLLSALHAVADPIGHPLLYSGACLWAGYGSVMGDQ